MSTDEPTTPPLRLPPIPLAALSEKTKDRILGRASYLGCSPEAVILELLDRGAELLLDGPKPTALAAEDQAPKEVAA